MYTPGAQPENMHTCDSVGSFYEASTMLTTM